MLRVRIIVPEGVVVAIAEGAGFPSRSLKVICESAIAPKAKRLILQDFLPKLIVPKHFPSSEKVG